MTWNAPSKFSLLNPRSKGRTRSELAGGQNIVEEVFVVGFPFDGETVQADAAFAPVSEILIGTHLLGRYKLEVNFVQRTVLLERVP